MRVIAGKIKGKKLEQIKTDDIRPTTDKVKESMFNVIQFDLIGTHFLDLFAGSGQIGIEALSRGANLVTFVDNNIKAINVIKRNLSAAHLIDKAKVVSMDATSFFRQTQAQFDIAFLDPPYKADLLQKLLPIVSTVMTSNGIIICEHPIETSLPSEVNNFVAVKCYKYGKTMLTVYKIEETLK